MAKKNKKNKQQLMSNIPNKVEEKVVDSSILEYNEGMTVKELAEKLGQPTAALIKYLFLQGKMVTINSSLDDALIEEIALEYNKEAIKAQIVDEVHFENIEIVDDPSDLVERAPVVTIMGHVDHGKTTLLDTIRKARVVEGEFGGITQHIGAYQTTIHGKKITFLDTPGHEAFTAMRARGAQVTDIVIIVVAADDGVMPQTKEAIDHALSAQVPIVVAINKIDKEGANLDRIMSEMSELGLMPEEWGGSTIFMPVSAKVGTGIEALLETLLVVAEFAELKANPNRYALGTVVEAKLDKGRGPVATLLVSNGTLRVGDPVVVGATFGKVRQMCDDLGQSMTSAGPSTPVEITGLNDVPEAGDHFMAFDSEKQARQIANQRHTIKKHLDRRDSSAMSLDDLYAQIQEGDMIDVNLIIKADVQGTAEAVKSTLEKLAIENVRVNVVRSTAGAITESDVLLASASKAIIYGFNVRPAANVRHKAEEEGVEIRLHNVIYKMVEELEQAMKGMLSAIFEESVTGQAEVRQLFKVSKLGTIAGCMVVDGVIKRDCGVRIIRDGVVIYEGKLASLKRFQNDTKEVAQGYDCGIMIENFNDLRENDIIEGYVMEEVERGD